MRLNLQEPAALVAFAKAVIYALAVFGLNFTPEQILALGAVVETGSILVIRSQTITKAHADEVLEASPIATSQTDVVKEQLGITPKAA